MLTRHSQWAYLPSAALLGLQIAVFIGLSGRGLDFTDEAYYLLNYQYGRDIAATTSFFGTFLEGPFRLLGHDVSAVRVFGLVLLVATGSLLSARVWAFTQGEESQVPRHWLVTGVAGSLLYYVHPSTLRAPSYNLLVLACIQASTAWLLALADAGPSSHRARLTAFLYGVAIGICALTKAPSAAAMATCHLVFLFSVAPIRRVPAWAAQALAGTAAVALAMQLANPRWIDALQAGIEFANALDAGFGALPSPTVGSVMALGVGGVAFGIAAALLRPGLPPLLRSILPPAIATIVMVPFVWPVAASAWWFLMGGGTALSLLIVRRCCPPGRKPAESRRHVALTLLLLALPLSYSIGTNGSLAAHSRMAAGLALLALMLAFRRQQRAGLLHPAALAIALALPCLPLIASQWRAWEDASATYRLGTGLADQQHPTTLGPKGRSLRLDAATKASVQELTRQMAAAGYAAGDPIIDMTGDGPGLVYALGARPLGAIWLLGGYPGSERAAEVALAHVPAGDLRRAWVISADDNPRALRNWIALLSNAGLTSLEPVGQVNWWPQVIPTGSPRRVIQLFVWRPRR